MLKVSYLAKTERKFDRRRTCQIIWPIVKNYNFDNFRFYTSFNMESTKINFKIDFSKMSISDVCRATKG